MVLFHRASKSYHYASCLAPDWLLIFLRTLLLKGTYICQFELIAGVALYLTFPDLLHGSLLHHFVDNMPALQNSIGGYSGKADSSLILHEFHIQKARLRCYPWFGFVYSEDNSSDGPSRGDFSLMVVLGATRRSKVVLPSLSSW